MNTAEWAADARPRANHRAPCSTSLTFVPILGDTLH